jgi:DNA-binding PadR family transcriptional regulator
VTIRFTILRCLIGAPSSGAEIEHALGALRHFYPLSHVNIHPVLNDLEYERLIRSEIRVTDGRPDRSYAVTPAGREAFARWQAEPPASVTPDVRDLVHLRLVLATDQTENLQWLSWVIPEVAEEADRARRTYARNRCSMTPVAQLAVEELIANLERRHDFLTRPLALAKPAVPSARLSEAPVATTNA